MYCLNLLKIAIELARTNPVYEDIASKFFQHFLYIAAAMNKGGNQGLWDEDDEFIKTASTCRAASTSPCESARWLA